MMGAQVWVDVTPEDSTLECARLHLSLGGPAAGNEDSVQMEVERDGVRFTCYIDLRDWRKLVRVTAQW